MTGKYLLDTNIVIALLNGESSVQEAIEGAEEVFLPVIAAGELYFGAAKSARPEANRALVEQFIQGRMLLYCDLSVAREYGRIKSLLKVRGFPLPENDIWIAAIAVRHGLAVVSRDQHFLKIEGLTTLSW